VKLYFAGKLVETLRKGEILDGPWHTERQQREGRRAPYHVRAVVDREWVVLAVYGPCKGWQYRVEPGCALQVGLFKKRGRSFKKRGERSKIGPVVQRGGRT